MYRIDSHHHFWTYSAAEYGWITEEMVELQRDFGPSDLKAEISAVDISAVISVQARQSLEETRALLDIANRNDFVRGVVGWVPFTAANVADTIEQFASSPKLRGVRHILHDEPDANYMLRDDFNRGVAALKQFGLVYDILIFERHLPQTIEFVDRHPNQVFVLDHIGKPRIRAAEISPWAERLEELARRPNVYCKLSGLATEADHRSWTAEQLGTYVNIVLEAFGPKRLMFGSDWPVCLLAVGYRDWVCFVEREIEKLSDAEQERIWSGTAIEAYNLGPTSGLTPS